MFFRSLGRFVSRFWPLLPAAWIALLAAVVVLAPPWESVITDGEFQFLPRQSPSLVGEQKFQEAFSKNFWGSSIMIVVRRDSREDSRLTEIDRNFVKDTLVPRLEEIIEENEWNKPTPPADGVGPAVPLLVQKISISGRDKEIGPLLNSRDGHATLVRISLTTEYLEKSNAPLIDAVQELIDPDAGELRRDMKIPAGLDLYLSGPAVVGKDMREAALKSASATESATVLLVIGLLLLIYRAPVLAFIPLVTVVVGVKIALGVLAMLAKLGVVTLFNGSEVYVTVVMYGAGVDYCMFLMARYKEELDAGATFGEGVAASISKVGPALVASAGTTIVGIGMMVFAEFGKFRQAGVAMSFSLIFVLLASLTLTPALLRLFGRWAFWPRIARERLAEPPGWISPTRFTSRLLEPRRLQAMWDHLAESIARRPGTWWLATTAIMLPLAVAGVLLHEKLTYGLLEELPTTTLSVQGARAVQDHFPAGEAGPLTILVADPDTAFATPLGEGAVRELTDRLWEKREDLGIEDVRSQAAPHGMRNLEGKTFVERRFLAKAATHKSYYVSDTGPNKGRITRLDVVFNGDPFSRGSLEQLDHLETAVERMLPEELEGSDLYFIGPTASIRDLKSVTNRDQIRIDLMVLAGVFAVLFALLRQVMVAGYLIVTVFFSYLVTLGATFGFFWATSPGEFIGLDWKVPMFLFTILVAVGEDYNIYLVTRVEEEQRRLGGVGGVREGLARTGGIISGCGLIMAGTFSSLMFGSLAGMVQLGFALTFGVILDTFVVRPILVPAYLVMLNNGQFGAASRWLGAYVPNGDEAIETEAPPTDDEHARRRRSVTATPVP
ncbi:MAG: MMPL family transporter [Planctomycetota bacterium]|nr:MMPL family transporter [Planctomycetota bacterium]